MPLIKSSGAGAAAPPAGKRDEPTVEMLVTGLQSAEPRSRRAAARGLSDHPLTAGVLCEALNAETEQSVREAIFTALIRIGSPAAADGLIPLLKSEDVGLRNGAVEALKTMPAVVGERVAEILAGPADARILGVEILGALAHPQSPHWLVGVLAEEPEINVCAAAVDALAECGDREAVAPLRRLLERFPDEPFLEFSVNTALARIANAS